MLETYLNCRGFLPLSVESPCWGNPLGIPTEFWPGLVCRSSTRSGSEEQTQTFPVGSGSCFSALLSEGVGPALSELQTWAGTHICNSNIWKAETAGV